MTSKLLIGVLAAGSLLVALAPTIASAAPPSFQFGITIGDPPPPPPPPGPKPHWPPPPPPPDDDCIPTKAIISDLGDEGYYKFRNYRDADDDYFYIDARLGSRQYRLTVDACDGEILNRKRLYQAY